jgi:prepilin-type N-terminal cleavage/methylation domain-containing protein
MTLTELLVTLALVGLVSMAALGLLEQGQRAWTIGAARAESQQSARVALARLVADVRALC